MMRALVVTVGIVLTLGQFPARAGSQGSGEMIFSVDQVAALSKGLERELARRGARVALISRVGRPADELPPGVDFTHVAFAVYSRIETNDGKTVYGYAVHNLYQDTKDPSLSSLVQDYPVDYFAPVHALRAGVIIPSPELQQALARTIASPAYARMHVPRYTVFSNPFDRWSQNCTEFVLYVLFSAIYADDDPEHIRADVKTYFAPQQVGINRLKVLIGSLFEPELDTRDQPGVIATTTFRSILEFMRANRMITESFTIELEPGALGAKTEPL
jgi:hypothetical protein